MKKLSMSYINRLLAGAAFLLIFGCSGDKDEIVIEDTVPVITIQAVTEITGTSAKTGGIITDDGGSEITGRGVCWCSGKTPTVSDSKTSDGKGSGSYFSTMTNLSPATSYNLRAYAVNSKGTGYSNSVSFTTLGIIPVITTAELTSVTSTSLVCGGNITSDGGAAITARGTCWGTEPNPETTGNKTSDGAGTGVFTSSITGLLPATTYYFRAYAINNIGTSYGAEKTIMTPAALAQVTSVAPASADISTTTAMISGNVTNDGGAPVTERGICYSNTPNPTVNNLKQHDTKGSGTGTFTCRLVGLSVKTLYHFRAYAINSAGTAYGEDLTFTTADPYIVTDIDGNTYHSVTIGTQIWMLENLKTTKYRDGTSIPNVTDQTSWTNQKTGAYCDYGNNPANSDVYGRLYNWYAVNDSRKLAPAGWHIPSDEEWTTLINYLGGMAVAGGKMKETGTAHWSSTYPGVTNESGFTALPGGYRDFSFSFIRTYAFWWSSTAAEGNSAWTRDIPLFESTYNDGLHVERLAWIWNVGFSVRCIKD